MFRPIERERTRLCVMLYSVYMYFQDLTLRAVFACLKDLCPRSHVSVSHWIQRFSHVNACFTVGRVRCFMVDETWIKVGSQEAWLWSAFEPYGGSFWGSIYRVRGIFLWLSSSFRVLLTGMVVIRSTLMELTGIMMLAEV